jgi:hypothetical protein
MKRQTVSRYDQITVDPRYGGYSDIRLWPCYMAFSSLILFLAPQIGMLLAIVLVGVPSFVIAKKVADKSAANEPIVRYNIDQWVDDMMAAEAKGLPMPEMEAYVVVEPKIEKQRVAKHSGKARSNPTFEQIGLPFRSGTKKPTLQSV